MQKQNTTSTFINVALLFSSLGLLTACDLFKKSGSANSGAGKGEVLCSINNKPCITVENFEDFWNAYLQSNPNAAQIVLFYPNIRYEMFANQLVPLKIAQEWVKAEKKDQNEDYKKRLKSQIDLIEGFMALELLKEDVLKSVDTSDAGLEKFYNENKSKSPMFQQEPFIKSVGSAKVLTVTFADENQAKDFAAKAKEQNANFAQLAKDAKKEVKDLGFINDVTKDVDQAIKLKAKVLGASEVDSLRVGKNFVVVKIVEKKDPEYASFADLKNNPQIVEGLKQALTQVMGQEQFTKKLDELKKTYGVTEKKEFFEKEKEKSKSEMESKLGQMQGEQPEQVEPAKEQTKAV